MNATLEAMARALFRSWFVDFDPVRAKMEGRDTGLPQEIADLFPDRLVDSELGEIPKGWRCQHACRGRSSESRVVEQSKRAGSDPLCRLGENEVGRTSMRFRCSPGRTRRAVLVACCAEETRSWARFGRETDRSRSSATETTLPAALVSQVLRPTIPIERKSSGVRSDFRRRHRPPRSPCGRRSVSGCASEGGPADIAVALPDERIRLAFSSVAAPLLEPIARRISGKLESSVPFATRCCRSWSPASCG